MNALGIYLLVSLFFVLATMVEFAVVLVLARFYPKTDDNDAQKNKENNKTRKRSLKKKFWPYSKMSSSHVNIKEAEGNPIIKEKNEKRIICSFTEKMDFIALLIFMFIYFIFNCVYFMHYM